MPTGRWMCLGCGQFFSYGGRPILCPYCGDAWLADNIGEDLPPRWTNVRVDFPCGHALSTDVGLDIKYCCHCGIEGKVYAHEGEHLSLKSWQLKELERLGI